MSNFVRTRSNRVIGILVAIAAGCLLSSSFSAMPASAATTTVQAFSPNVSEAIGGQRVEVSGKYLDQVTKLRIAGVTQSKLSNRTKTKFSFVVPRLSSTLQKYGGYVKVELLSHGIWKSAGPKFLATAARSKAFTSAGLTYKLLETSRPGSVPRVGGLGDLYPSPNAQLHGVKRNVLNMSDSWVDLTCAMEVDVRVIDKTFRRFSDSGDRYEFAGNPHCNTFMNPGFSADCLWVFDVPNMFKTVALEVSTVSWSGPTPKTFYFGF